MTTETQSTAITQYLQNDHARLDGLVSDAREVLQSGDSAGASTFFRQFRKGLLRHIQIEEEMLFPLFESATGFTSSGPTSVMRSEHIEILKIIDQMNELFEGKDVSLAGFDSLHARLKAVLVPHNQKEEMILYPESDRLITGESKSELVRNMQEYQWKPTSAPTQHS
jgi:regulator of cell morphogenesis and NO signaling